MNNIRRAGVILASTLLTFGVVSMASPADARDTSWGGIKGRIIQPVK